MEVTKYIPLNLGMLIVPWNWFYVTVVVLAIVLTCRLLNTDTISPAANAANADEDN